MRAAKEEIEKDRRKERGVHLHGKAVENFRALLTDMVRQAIVILSLIDRKSSHIPPPPMAWKANSMIPDGGDGTDHLMDAL